MDSQNKILGKCKQNIIGGLVLLLDKVELKAVNIRWEVAVMLKQFNTNTILRTLPDI